MGGPRKRVMLRRLCLSLSEEQLDWARRSAPDGNVSKLLRRLVREGLTDWDALPPDVRPSADKRARYVINVDEEFDLMLRMCYATRGERPSSLFRRCIDRARTLEG